jgi:hypothetical protein
VWASASTRRFVTLWQLLLGAPLGRYLVVEHTPGAYGDGRRDTCEADAYHPDTAFAKLCGRDGIHRVTLQCPVVPDRAEEGGGCRSSIPLLALHVMRRWRFCAGRWSSRPVRSVCFLHAPWPSGSRWGGAAVHRILKAADYPPLQWWLCSVADCICVHLDTGIHLAFKSHS